MFLIEDFCLRRRPLRREGQWEQEAVILEQGIQVRDADLKAAQRRAWGGGRGGESLTIVLSLWACVWWVGAGWGRSADAGRVRGTTEGRGARGGGEEGRFVLLKKGGGRAYVCMSMRGQSLEGNWRGRIWGNGHLCASGYEDVCE